VTDLPLLFYSAWPLGFHNPEGERKALGFAEAGFDVTYVAGIGIRNPRMASAGKAIDRAKRKLAPSRGRTAVPTLRVAGLAVLPPRQLRPMRRINAAWVEQQLSRAIPGLGQGVAWIRWPTPELVDALARLQPAVVVYECVDAYHHTPGITGAWAERFSEAEAALVELADAVVVPGEALASRFRQRGVEVHVVPHGVQPFPWREPRSTPAGAATIGFVGTLDYRIDVPVLRAVASHHPDWRIRMIGPVSEGFDPSAFADLPNVSIEPPVPHEQLGSVLATFDAGIMPYAAQPVFSYMSPVKTLELMAAGKPAVARPSAALVEHAHLFYFADTPHQFVAQLERALVEDSAERARARRAVAERNTWDERMAELRTIVQEALARKVEPQFRRSER
jgi:glycosyltransferase involved in cell wall biosynthesis